MPARLLHARSFTPRPFFPGGLATCLLASIITLVSGCESTPEPPRKQIMNPFAGLPNVQWGDGSFDPPQSEQPAAQPGSSDKDQPTPPTPVEELIKVDARGTRTIISTAPRHVVAHLRRLLISADDDLDLWDQIISQQTKRRIIAEGGKLEDLVPGLKSSGDELLKMLEAMPSGELSLSAELKNAGEDRWVLRLRSSPLTNHLQFTRLWMVRENRVYKFLWAD
jgi:hypothetical protein